MIAKYDHNAVNLACVTQLQEELTSFVTAPSLLVRG